MPDKLEVLPGPGLVARYDDVAVWAGPQASPALQVHLVNEAQRTSKGANGGDQLASSLIAILQRGDPEPQAPFAVVGPGANGLTLFLHGPVQAWDSGRWLAPQPVPGWMVTSVGRPWPLIILPYGASPPPQSQQGNPLDLVGGAVPGAGFVMLRPPSAAGQAGAVSSNRGITPAFAHRVLGPSRSSRRFGGGRRCRHRWRRRERGGPGRCRCWRRQLAAASGPWSGQCTWRSWSSRRYRGWRARRRSAGHRSGRGGGRGSSRGGAPAWPPPGSRPGAARPSVTPPAEHGRRRGAGAQATWRPLPPGLWPSRRCRPPAYLGGTTTVDLRNVFGAGRPPLELAAAAALSYAPDQPEVLGVRCELGHFNHPRVMNCLRCGRPIPPGSPQVSGPRPPVGVLLADDGSIWALARGCLIGADPGSAPEVQSGASEAISMKAGANHAMAPVQSEVQVRDWSIYLVDRGAEGGSWVQGPTAQTWEQLGRNEQRELANGSHLSCGGRVLTYLSAWPS